MKMNYKRFGIAVVLGLIGVLVAVTVSQVAGVVILILGLLVFVLAGGPPTSA